jgi:glycosyltransferase involved in cell wall biosynthesis
MRVVLIGYCNNVDVRSKIEWGSFGPGGDVAMWNTLLIRELEKYDDIELYVIAPMVHMKRMTQKFAIGKTRYYFFKPDVPFLSISWRHVFNLDKYTNFWLARRLVQRWIREINPEIVNLLGAENPNYSASILGLKEYPVFVTLQSIYSNPERFKVVAEDRLRSKFERWIFSENKYFGANAPQEPPLVRRDSPNATFMWNRFPQFPNVGRLERVEDKKYDFIQFSGMTELKGVPDTIKATALVKKAFPSVRVKLMGGWPPGYMEKMQALAASLELNTNVELSPGFAQHADLLAEAQKGRCYILPTKVDTIPTTIFEATQLGMPVVSYKTGDIPQLNTGDERVLLADRGDVDGLADQMLRLMCDPKLGIDLNRKTREFSEKFFSNEFNVQGFIDIYKAVIANYRDGTSIPEDLMYEGFLARKLK